MKIARDLRIVFMGTPQFASEVLEELCAQNYNIVGVVTAPDRPAGRGREMKCSAVKDSVLKINELTGVNIPILQPEKLRNEEFISELEALQADLFIVVAFRMLPKIVWQMPRLGTFNLHASLLPEYRGAAPINWAIINGETKTGVTTFFLNEEIDCGSVILQHECDIQPSDNVGVLHDKLLAIGKNLVVDTVEVIASENYELRPQSDARIDELKAAPKLFKGDMELDFSGKCEAEHLHNKVRGLSPYPAAWGIISGRGVVEGIDKEDVRAKVYVTHTESIDSDTTGLCTSTQGQEQLWYSDGKTFLRLKTRTKWLYIDELQPENKKRMSIADFLRGWR